MIDWSKRTGFFVGTHCLYTRNTGNATFLGNKKSNENKGLNQSCIATHAQVARALPQRMLLFTTTSSAGFRHQDNISLNPMINSIEAALYWSGIMRMPLLLSSSNPCRMFNLVFPSYESIIPYLGFLIHPPMRS